jgi:amino acid adenylation domain-containing protein
MTSSAVSVRIVPDDIRAHADRDPGATALVTPAGEVSYGRLAERIEHLARVLVAAGVRPDDRCVVALEPGVDAIVAINAVLRAGGAFVTLDVQQPAARLASMVRTADAGFLVSTAVLASRLDLPIPGPAVLLDRVDGLPELPPPDRIDPQDLAYASHTSGSTGVPRAVLIPHRGFHPFLRFVVRHCGLDQNTVTLQLGPLGWDASIRDTFAPLVAGGRLVLLPRSVLLRPETLFGALDTYGVDTILSTTPTFLTALADHPDAAERLERIRLIATSAESLRPFLGAGHRRLIAGRLVNLYGPTECTVTATCFEVPQEPDTGADLIGTSIDGAAAHLLDSRMCAVADGGMGEIYLGGAGVTRGYQGDPYATAEKFVPDPFSGEPGARLYRTGDLGRRRDDGTLEFLGRCDRQIKIRGYRVEPAEIEGTLVTHPAVRSAVVTAATDARGRVYLVAHVVGDLGEVTDGALRAHLARTLPPYLMPRRFVRFERFPATRNGKIDRAALTAAGSGGAVRAVRTASGAVSGATR